MSVNSPQIRSLLGKLTGPHIQFLLDTEAKPEYRRDEKNDDASADEGKESNAVGGATEDEE